MASPFFTLSPTATKISLTTPARSLGTSMAALSDSSVINVSSTESVSPTAIAISMISTSSSVPRSGTRTSTRLACAGSAASCSPPSLDAGSCSAGCAASPDPSASSDLDSPLLAGAAESSAAPSTSSVTIRLPLLTLSPRFTSTVLITPALGAGISIAALSLSSTSRESSSATVSPTTTNNSITSTSLASPRSGTKIFSIVTALSLPRICQFACN